MLSDFQSNSKGKIYFLIILNFGVFIDIISRKKSRPSKSFGGKRHAPGHERARAISIFTRVGTYAYVQRGSKFCFVVVVLVVGTVTLIRILHFRPISPRILHHCMHPCLARQPYPATLPGSLARQPCPCSLAWQPCSAALPKFKFFGR
jgi:hypothetical protein